MTHLLFAAALAAPPITTAAEIAQYAAAHQQALQTEPSQVLGRRTTPPETGWQTFPSAEAAVAALEPSDAMDVPYIELMTNHTLVGGALGVVHQVIAVDTDSFEFSYYLFHAGGRLLQFSHHIVGFGGLCQPSESTVTVDYIPGEMAKRSFKHTLGGDEPFSAGVAAQCEKELAEYAAHPDPGWGPRWLHRDELPKP